jgi:hypothetical protein
MVQQGPDLTMPRGGAVTLADVREPTLAIVCGGASCQMRRWDLSWRQWGEWALQILEINR